MIFERNYFLLMGGFNESMPIGEDFDIAQKSVRWGVRAKFLNKIAVTYSLRRIRREGKFKVYYKYLLSTMQYLIQGKNKGNLFKYEMGGQLYKDEDIKKTNVVQEILDKAKKSFVTFLKK